MHYPDGQLARLGDRLHLWDGAAGRVVCSLDTGEFSNEYQRDEWAYLGRGILILGDATGLMHCTEPKPTFRLIERAAPGAESSGA